MRWLLLHCVLLTFFGGLHALESSQATFVQSIVTSIDSHQSISTNIHDSNLSRFSDFVWDCEEEETEEDKHSSNRKASQFVPQPAGTDEIIAASLLSPKKPIKFYILFLSWKLFLHI